MREARTLWLDLQILFESVAIGEPERHQLLVAIEEVGHRALRHAVERRDRHVDPFGIAVEHVIRLTTFKAIVLHDAEDGGSDRIGNCWRLRRCGEFDADRVDLTAILYILFNAPDEPEVVEPEQIGPAVMLSQTAQEAMRLAAHKLPMKCKFVKRVDAE